MENVCLDGDVEVGDEFFSQMLGASGPYPAPADVGRRGFGAAPNFLDLLIYKGIHLRLQILPLAVRPRRVPLPESFYSIETGEPIDTCLACDAPLLGEETEYLLEKGIRRYEEYDVQETVFQYALCMECHAAMRESFSETSMRRCQAFLSEHVDLAGRTARLLGTETPDPDDWLRRCIVHDTPREDLEEYQVMAHCQGDQMLMTHLPLLMGGPAMDELVQCLSNETIDELGGFRDEHLGLPPELEHDLQGPVVA